jgi:hypothetical protein
MMARANPSNAAALPRREDTSSGTASRILSTSRGAPITPVEQTRICEGSMLPSSLARWTAVARAAASPSLPEQQFAFPELTIKARISRRDFFKCDRDRITGAAATRFVVKTAAAAAGVSLTRIPRSSLDFFSPQWVAANVKPRGTSEADTFALMFGG